MKVNRKKLDLALARNIKTLSCFRGKGLSTHTLRKIRNGESVTPVTFGKLAKALGVDPADLVEDESE